MIDVDELLKKDKLTVKELGQVLIYIVLAQSKEVEKQYNEIVYPLMRKLSAQDFEKLRKHVDLQVFIMASINEYQIKKALLERNLYSLQQQIQSVIVAEESERYINSLPMIVSESDYSELTREDINDSEIQERGIAVLQDSKLRNKSAFISASGRYIKPEIPITIKEHLLDSYSVRNRDMASKIYKSLIRLIRELKTYNYVVKTAVDKVLPDADTSRILYDIESLKQSVKIYNDLVNKVNSDINRYDYYSASVKKQKTVELNTIFPVIDVDSINYLNIGCYFGRLSDVNVFKMIDDTVKSTDNYDIFYNRIDAILDEG